MSVRVAVVGSGPSGMYAADALVERGALVDVFDRLPVPFGLVRYGVAPDHTSIRSVRDTLDQIWDKDGIRFLGNIDVGADIPIEELQSAYDAVILTYGAATDRRLGVPGEDLPGSVAATDLVAWYTGHPDYQGPDFDALLPTVRRVAVVGVGNVAVDVVRVLSKSPDELVQTDMPDHVLRTLSSTQVEHVYLIGRRGPAQASFTTKELRELGELERADVRVDPADLENDPVSSAELADNKVAARNATVLHDWLARGERTDADRVVEFMFFHRPTAVNGQQQVTSIEVERTEFDTNGRLVGTGRTQELPVDLVVRSVGYQGTPMPGVPFDTERHVIPNVDGRVMDGEAVVPGLYVAGWIKRGPSGIIGTNKKCAVGTVASLWADVEQGAIAVDEPARSIDTILDSRGLIPIGVDGWRDIDAQERQMGSEHGKPRVTIHEREQLMRIGTGQH